MKTLYTALTALLLTALFATAPVMANTTHSMDSDSGNYSIFNMDPDRTS